jgi:hypothetical protein
MKIQWHDGAMQFRPTTVMEANSLARLYRAMGGTDSDGNPRDIWLTSECPGVGDSPTTTIPVNNYADVNPPLAPDNG